MSISGRCSTAISFRSPAVTTTSFPSNRATVFHDYLRDFIAADRSWADVARELLTASGNSFSSRTRQLHRALPAAERTHSGHLGHDHRQRHRRPSWATRASASPVTTAAATWSRSISSSPPGTDRFLADVRVPLAHEHHPGAADTNFRSLGLPGPGPAHGGYTSWVDPNNPGPRPARSGGPYSPAFLLTGDTPQIRRTTAANSRACSPPTGSSPAPPSIICGRRCSPWESWIRPGQWDLARIDPANPPPDPWTLQPTHPELIEALATEFINSNYSVKHMVRLMATSQRLPAFEPVPGHLEAGLRAVFRTPHHPAAAGRRDLRRGGAGHHDRHAHEPGRLRRPGLLRRPTSRHHRAAQRWHHLQRPQHLWPRRLVEQPAQLFQHHRAGAVHDERLLGQLPRLHRTAARAPPGS